MRRILPRTTGAGPTGSRPPGASIPRSDGVEEEWTCRQTARRRETRGPTVFLNHPQAETYAALIAARFPDVRMLSGTGDGALARCLPEADILLSSALPGDHLDKAGKLRWFQCTSAGVDSVIAVRDRMGDVVVTNARGIHGDIIADFVIGGITALHWDFRDIFARQAERRWVPRLAAPFAGRTMTIIGMGSIGSAIAVRAKAAGMTVLGVRRDHRPRWSRSTNSTRLRRSTTSCRAAISSCLPFLPRRRRAGSSNGRRLRLMRKSVILVNIARGSVVAEAELVQALQEGVIAGALLDVFEQEPLPETSPFGNMANVIVTPHIAGSLDDYTEQVFGIFADNIARFMAGQPLRNRVDLGRGY